MIKEYIKLWGYEVDDTICENLASLWKIINKNRKIGPAIIQDIYGYVQNTNPADYVSATILYSLPQFEGLLEEIQIELIKEIISLQFIDRPKELIKFSSDFFGIDIRKFE